MEKANISFKPSGKVQSEKLIAGLREDYGNLFQLIQCKADYISLCFTILWKI